MQECTFCSLFFKKISLYYYFGLVVQCHNNILVRKGMTQNSEVSSLIVLFPQLYFCYFQIARFTLAWTHVLKLKDQGQSPHAMPDIIGNISTFVPIV